ncbi:aminoglycoside phosphotransferase [Chromatium weissei]|nr:aminoglycoside phosphotransferase [Chromatium weissei]
MDHVERNHALRQWLTTQLHPNNWTLTPASSDASFRRYWRVTLPKRTLIAMDAPPPIEDCGRFADLAEQFRAVGINTPEIFAADRARGFLLLTDFGRQTYLDVLTSTTADRLYGDALGALAIMQTCVPTANLPIYDAAFLQRELALFDEWFIEKMLGLELTAAEQTLLTRVNNLLIANALEQPQVCVHRDFHSRNLMRTARANPGVLDFQDAVLGPVTYDLVSLLRDCYIAWPTQRVTEWALGYHQLARQSGILRTEQPEQFLRWFDRMGMQRHLKVCGIFARLHLRDGKSHYLADLPRILNYLVEVAERDSELTAFRAFLIERVMPRI